MFNLVKAFGLSLAAVEIAVQNVYNFMNMYTYKVAI